MPLLNAHSTLAVARFRRDSNDSQRAAISGDHKRHANSHSFIASHRKFDESAFINFDD